MKRSGWRNESYRHYLAAKGIATKYKYYSKFGDFLRTTGNELQAGQEKYYREEPAKEAARLRMQQAVFAKERETPLTVEEQKAMQESIARAGKSYTEARLQERYSTYAKQYDFFNNAREAKKQELRDTISELEDYVAQVDEKYREINEKAHKGGVLTPQLRADAEQAHKDAVRHKMARESQLNAELNKYEHNQDLEYKGMERIQAQIIALSKVRKGKVATAAVDRRNISAEVKTNG